MTFVLLIALKCLVDFGGNSIFEMSYPSEKMGFLPSFSSERVSTDWLRFAVISNSFCVL